MYYIKVSHTQKENCCMFSSITGITSILTSKRGLWCVCVLNPRQSSTGKQWLLGEGQSAFPKDDPLIG